MKNILTVDTEDWYHICDIEHILPSASWDRCESRMMANVESILTLLSRFKVKATFFALRYVPERRPEVVKLIYGEGHKVASDGYGHAPLSPSSPPGKMGRVRGISSFGDSCMPAGDFVWMLVFDPLLAKNRK